MYLLDLKLEEFKLNTLWIISMMCRQQQQKCQCSATSLRFTFTQVSLPKSIFLFILLLKYRMRVLLTSLALADVAQVYKAEHTRRDDRSKWVDQWMGFATDGFCSPRCSKKEEELFTAATKKKMEIQQRPPKKAPGTSLLFKSHVLHLRKQFICLCSI